MTEDETELETRLHAHYRRLEPGPATATWSAGVRRALEARRLRGRTRSPWAAVAAMVVLAAGAAGALALAGQWSRVAAPSALLPVSASGLTPSGNPSPANPSPVPAADSGRVDAAGTFGPHGVWTIRGARLEISSDAGETWQIGSAPVSASQNAMQPVATLLDANTGWVVNSGPGTTAFDGAPTDVQPLVVSRTTDGGRTWRSTTLPGNFPGVSVSVSFADSQRGFILATPFRGSLTPGAVLATDDGGAHWHTAGTSRTWATHGMTPWLGNKFVASDATTLWAGANQEAGPVVHPVLAVSRDGGATWREATLPGTSGMLGGPQNYVPDPPLFTGPQDGIVTLVTSGADGSTSTRLFRTSDNGGSWRAAGPLPQQAASGPIVLGASHWLMLAANPSRLLETTDGGATWHAATPSGLPDGWWAISGAGIDDSHAMLVVEPTTSSENPGILYLTADAGRTWHPAELGPAPTATGAPSPVVATAAPSPSAPPSAAAASMSAEALGVASLPSGIGGAGTP